MVQLSHSMPQSQAISGKLVSQLLQNFLGCMMTALVLGRLYMRLWSTTAPGLLPTVVGPNAQKYIYRVLRRPIGTWASRKVGSTVSSCPPRCRHAGCRWVANQDGRFLDARFWHPQHLCASAFRWENMKATPARAALYSAAVWLLCIAAMVASGGIVLLLAKQSAATRREREYCDDTVRDEQGYLPSSCCADGTLENGNCVEAAVCASCQYCMHPLATCSQKNKQMQMTGF